MNCDLTVSELFQAYYDCRKTKRNTWNAIEFEQNLERNLMDLYYELVNNTYQPGRSIMFVVVYLDVLDQYAKHALKLKYYARYVDDIVVIGQDGGDLHESYEKMATFVQQQLGISFHPNKKEINKVEHGVNFVGYIIKPWCKYVRRSTIKNMRLNVAKSMGFDALRATINSYLGMLRHANAYKERVKITAYLCSGGARFNRELTKLTKLGVSLCIS